MAPAAPAPNAPNAPNPSNPPRPKKNIPKFKKNKPAATDSSSADPPVPTTLPPVPSTVPQSSASSQPPPKLSLPEGYTAIARWGQGDVLVLYGTNYAPPDPRSLPSDHIIVGKDGRWGPHEWALHPQPYDEFSPYLVLLEVPTAPELEQPIVFRAPLDADREFFHPKSDTDSTLIRRDNLFVVKESVRNQLYKRARYLRGLFSDAVSLLRRASTQQGQEAIARLDAATVAMLGDLRIPHDDVAHMWRMYGMLREGGLRSRAEWNACWRSFQRSLATMSAFIDLCGELLPDDLCGDAPGILKCFRERRLRHDNTSKGERRGAILAVENIATHLQLLLRLKAPAYLLAAEEHLDIAGVDIRSPDSWRCSIEADAKLVTLSLRDLPSVCYLPQDTAWGVMERTARGFLEAPTPIEPSTRVLGQKAKAKRIEEDKANKSAAKKKKDARREEALAVSHPDVQTSAELYRTFAWRAPQIRSFYDRKHLKRQPFAPEPLPRFKAGFARALKHVHLMNDSGSLKTFLPSLNLFTEANTEKPERVLRYLVMLVWLTPTLLSRVELSRTEPAVVRYGTNDFKVLLGGERFIFAMPKGERGELQGADFWAFPHKQWKYGGDELWGSKVSQELREHPDGRPYLGKLACGCEPSTDEFTNNTDLAESVIYELNQLALLHHLAHLAKPSDLEKAGIPIVQEPKKIRAMNGVDIQRIARAGPSHPVGAHATKKSKALEQKGLAMPVPTVPKSKFAAELAPPSENKDAPMLFAHCMPSIRELQEAKDSSMLGLIRRVVLQHDNFDEHGSPPSCSADTVYPPARRAWLQDFKALLMRTAYAKELDIIMANDPQWLSVYALSNKYPGSLNWTQQEELEEHLFWRYALTSFKCGRVPVEFCYEPQRAPGRCRNHSGVVLREGMTYEGLLDENEDEEDDWY